MDWLTGLGGSAAGIAVAGTIAWLAAEGGASYAGVPIIVLCLGFAYMVQWIMFAHAWLRRTEQFYDLTGSVTYIVMVVSAVVISGQTDVWALIIAALIVVWAARLGTFLFKRIRKDGDDRRFRRAKESFPTFFMFWTLQGTWVFITACCALAAITSQNAVPMDITFFLGLALWVFGFVVEVVADTQKSRFRADPANRNDFICSGLWACSRHPNYFGEIVLWLGIAVMAMPALQGWQYVTLISPVFVLFLLTLVSGVRMLENRADKQWGDDPEYQAYKRKTPVLMLWFPQRKSVQTP